MKWLLTGMVATALIVAASAQGGSSTTLVIRHQVRGCHAWSVNGGPYKATQVAQVRRGATIKFTNNDAMPHKLIKTGGPSIVGHGRYMNGMMSTASVKFTHAGVYTFKTKAGEDYKGMHMPPTKGKDSVLKLTVTVK